MNSKRSGGLLDVFIILLIVLGVIGICLRMQALQGEEETDSFCRVRMTVRDIPKETADCIAEGESLYTHDGLLFGMVETVEANPARVRVYRDGVRYQGEWEDMSRVDLTLWLTLVGSGGEHAFLRDGKYAVLVGEEVLLYGERSALTYVTSEVVRE